MKTLLINYYIIQILLIKIKYAKQSHKTSLLKTKLSAHKDDIFLSSFVLRTNIFYGHASRGAMELFHEFMNPNTSVRDIRDWVTV